MSLHLINLDLVIQQHPVFAGMTSTEQAAISHISELVQIKQNQFLAKEGDVANCFYLINQGLCSIEMHTKSGNVILQTLGKNEIVGWSWLYEPYLWTFDVRAIENSEIIKFDGKLLLDLCKKDPKFGFEFIKRFSKIIATRLQQTRLRLLDMYGQQL